MLRGKLESARGGQRQRRELADHAGEPGMAQAFLHRGQHMLISADLDEDHAIGRQSGKVQRRGEQVAPA